MSESEESDESSIKNSAAGLNGIYKGAASEVGEGRREMAKNKPKNKHTLRRRRRSNRGRRRSNLGRRRSNRGRDSLDWVADGHPRAAIPCGEPARRSYAGGEVGRARDLRRRAAAALLAEGGD
jgi:hypothetical protein